MGSLSNYSGGLNGPRAKNKERIKNLLALNEADFLPDDRRGGAPSGPEKVLIALSEGVARTAKELAGCYDLSEFVAYLVMREAEKRKTGALSAPVYTEKAILPDVSSKISSEGALDRGSHPEGRKSGTICD